MFKHFLYRKVTKAISVWIFLLYVIENIIYLGIKLLNGQKNMFHFYLSVSVPHSYFSMTFIHRQELRSSVTGARSPPTDDLALTVSWPQHNRVSSMRGHDTLTSYCRRITTRILCNDSFCAWIVHTIWFALHLGQKYRQIHHAGGKSKTSHWQQINQVFQ